MAGHTTKHLLLNPDSNKQQKIIVMSIYLVKSRHLFHSGVIYDDRPEKVHFLTICYSFVNFSSARGFSWLKAKQ